MAALADIVNAERRKALILAARAKGVKPKTLDFPIWREIAKPKQLRPEGARCFIIRGGRGAGKTRSGAEDCLERIRCGARLVNVVAPTYSAVVVVCFDGVSGIIACARPGEIDRVVYGQTPTIYFTNGAKARGYSGEAPDKLNGPNCFVAGTIVSAPLGDVPIEAIHAGDLVLTRKGPKTVRWTSTRVQKVGKVCFTNGAFLIGTADHPVYTNNGWTKLSDLKEGAEVCAINAWNGAENVGTGTTIGITSTVALGASKGKIGHIFTGRYGSPLTGRFQKGSTSTTLTKTRATTLLKTSRCCRDRFIYRFTQKQDPPCQKIGKTHRRSFLFARTAANKWNGSATRQTQGARNATRNALSNFGRSIKCVPNVDQNLYQETATTVANVASTWQPVGATSVYCLNVQDQPEYFANGILVHNCDHLWVDEYGLVAKEAIDMARLGCRLGEATSCFTSTPKPTLVTRYVQKIYPDAHLSVIPMADNAENLHPDFVKEQFLAYGGTRFAKSELEGELLDEIVGALWREEWFNREGFRVKSRIRQRPDGLLVFDRPRDMVMISIGVDPTVSMNRKHKLDVESGLLAADECGIVATGLYDDGTGEVIADVSGVYDATEWPRKVAKLYALLNAEVICAEKNQGGSLIKLAIAGHAPTANIKEVWASADKLSRATPLANLYEQGRFRHGPGTEQLEKEMVDWDASDKSALSPGRIDAAVWASHGLGLLRATGIKTTGGIVLNEVYGQRH